MIALQPLPPGSQDLEFIPPVKVCSPRAEIEVVTSQPPTYRNGANAVTAEGCEREENAASRPKFQFRAVLTSPANGTYA
jgi:hypothetical protein